MDVVPENELSSRRVRQEKRQEKGLNKDKFSMAEPRETDRHLEHPGVVLGGYTWAEAYMCVHTHTQAHSMAP